MNERMRALHPRWRWALAGVLAVALTLLASSFVAGAVVRQRALTVLGEGAELGWVTLGWNGAIIAHNLRLPAPTARDWPEDADTLRAARVIVHPQWSAVLRRDYRIALIEIEDAYLSVLRAQGEGVIVLPTVLRREVGERARREWDGSVEIERVEIRGSRLDFYDRNIRQPPLKLRVEDLQAQLNNIRVPALSTAVQVDIGGRVLGDAHDGALGIRGWVNLRTRDSTLEIALHQLDLIAVQPYVVRSSEIGVQTGLLDLQLNASVRGRQLDAPGRLQLSQLHFVAGDGLQGTFMGSSRIAVLKFMEQKRGELALDFRLQGDLDDPHFKLEEALPLRLAVGVAEVLGVSVKGVVSGVGTLGGKGLEAVGDAAKGLGKLLGADEDEPAASKPPAQTH